jgi:hypothetical protein
MWMDGKDIMIAFISNDYKINPMFQVFQAAAEKLEQQDNERKDTLRSV